MISILVVGSGNMGASHAQAYEKHSDFSIRPFFLFCD